MLRKQRQHLSALLEIYARERKLMARLAAKTPQFSNRVEVWEAEKLRDAILGGVRGGGI
jgi:hypothetical protein